MVVSIGVVIPTYNRAEETLRAVDSALSQTREPDEIVVVDDGSTADVHRKLTRDLSRSPVRLILQPHCGHPGRVRNVGVNELTTSHIAFLDSDDIWVRDKLAIQEELAMAGARAQGSGFFLHGVVQDINAESVIETSQKTLRDLLSSNLLCNSSVLVEARLLRQIGGLPVSYAVRGIEDYAAWLRIAYVTPWTFLESPLVQYSDVPETSMRGTNHFSVPEDVLALWDFAAWLKEQGHRVPLMARLGVKVGNYLLQHWAARQTRALPTESIEN